MGTKSSFFFFRVLSFLSHVQSHKLLVSLVFVFFYTFLNDETLKNFFSPYG